MHDLICDWLKLPAGTWPPDHYTLLGLEPGVADIDRIEQQVHQRLEAVRRYQLTHPEQATEAMNRLARAFVCLTDPAAKKAYDAGLLGEQPVVRDKAAAEAATAPEEQEAPVQLVEPPSPPSTRPADRSLARTQADWSPPARPHPPGKTSLPTTDLKKTPRPLPALNPAAPAEPAPKALAPQPVAVPVSPSGSGTYPAAVPAPAAGALPPPPAPGAPDEAGGGDREDPALEAARSGRARRGLGTKRALYRRLARTRQLARAWEGAGKYLAWPKRRLTRPAEAQELIDVLTSIRTLLRGFPPLLGEAGQPGYLVVALARQQVIVPTFQTLLASQREALARDWWAGRTLLAAHREFLRQELRVLRKKNALVRALRAVWTFFVDQPGWILLLLALVAINVAIWRTFFAR